MTKALELAKFGRESPPAGAVVGDSDTQTLSSKTFSDGPVFSGLNANGVPFLNASKVLSSSSTFIFDGTNLGIGVASPAYRFDVQGSGAGIGVARFASNDTNTTTALAIFQRNGGAVSAAVKYNATNSPLTIDFGTTTNHALTFITADTERMRISSDGLAVTGTLSAGNTTLTGTNALTVNRSGAQGQITLQNNGTSTGILIAGATNGLVFYDAAAGLQMGTWAYAAGLAVTGPLSATGNLNITSPAFTDSIAVINSTSTNVSQRLNFTANGTLQTQIYDDADQTIISTVTSKPLIFKTANTERLRIESNGTIKKLGTNGGLLLMDGNTAGGVKIGSYTSNFLGDGYLAFEGYSIEYGRFDSAGNFMVGVTSTSAIANRNIDVNGTGDASFNIRVGGTTRAYFYSTAGQTLLGTNTNIPITFYPNNIERMKIATDGAVTIGNAIAATNVVLNFNGVANKAKRLVFQDSGVDQWIMGSGAASENDAFEIYNANGQMALSFAKASSNATFVGSVTTSRLNVTNNSAYAIEVYGTGLVQDAPSGNNDHIATARVRIGYMRSTNIGTIASNGGDSGLSLITHSSSTGWKESVRIQPSGNVGIGTTDPQDKLHVAGVIRSDASTTGTLYLGQTSGGATYVAAALVGTPSTLYAPIGRLSFRLPTHGANTDYGLTEQMFIEGTGADSRGAYKLVMLPHGGNVGIGKTNPQVALDIVGNAQVTTTAAGTYGLIAVGSSGGARDIFLAGQSGFSNGFTVRYDGASMVYAFQDGNVCIGATTPFGNFGVAGSTNLGNNVSSTQAAQYFTRLSGYAPRYDASNRYGSYGQLIFHANDQWTSGARRWMITNVLGVTNFGIIRSVDANTDPIIGDGGSISSGTVDFTITNAGLVGIGNATPTNKLDVSGTIGKKYTSNITVPANNTSTAVLNLSNGENFSNWLGTNFSTGGPCTGTISITWDTNGSANSSIWSFAKHSGFNGVSITLMSSVSYNGDTTVSGGIISIRNNGVNTLTPIFNVIVTSS